MAKVLITGACGFTGRYLTRELAGAGHEVHGTTHGSSNGAVAGISCLHEVDIADAESVRRVVASVRPDRVVHLAAIAFVAHSDVAEMYRSNVVGTRNILDALAKGTGQPDAVLIASSANIYGNAREGVLDEQVSPAPANDYGVTKVAAEYVTSLYWTQLPVIVGRPFNYTGRGQSTDFLIPKIVAHARSRAPEIELGNIDIARDFSDVRGIVRAYSQLIEAPAAIGGTFNGCSGRATSLNEVLNMVRQLSGHDFKVRINPAFVRSDDVKTLCGSARRLEETIGKLEMPPLQETLQWMLAE
jgi:nucleoside-diphosphate-sugar epimerase